MVILSKLIQAKLLQNEILSIGWIILLFNIIKSYAIGVFVTIIESLRK